MFGSQTACIQICSASYQRRGPEGASCLTMCVLASSSVTVSQELEKPVYLGEPNEALHVNMTRMLSGALSTLVFLGIISIFKILRKLG